MTPASTNSSITPLPPDPLPFGDDSVARERATASAQPFWGRFFRAAFMLGIAALAHLWLARMPGDRSIAPTLATTVTESGSLAQALTTGAAVEAATATDTRSPGKAGVTVRTELIPVTAIGVDQPAGGAQPIPSALPQPTGTAGMFAADQRESMMGEATPVSSNAAEEPASPVEPAPSRNEELAPTPQPDLTPLSASRRPLRELPRVIAASALPVRAGSTPRIINAAPIVEPDPREQVHRVLQQYAQAYERLDAQAAKEVWPSVNDTALRRAFSQLEEQRVTFASCDYKFSGREANARCQGENEYLPRVGPRTPRRVSREWTFDLAKADNGWHIVRAIAR